MFEQTRPRKQAEPCCTSRQQRKVRGARSVDVGNRWPGWAIDSNPVLESSSRRVTGCLDLEKVANRFPRIQALLAAKVRNRRRPLYGTRRWGLFRFMPRDAGKRRTAWTFDMLARLKHSTQRIVERFEWFRVCCVLHESHDIIINEELLHRCLRSTGSDRATLVIPGVKKVSY